MIYLEYVLNYYQFQTIATVFWEAYWSSFAVCALESVVVPSVRPGRGSGAVNPLFSLLGVDSHVKTIVLSLLDYARDFHSQGDHFSYEIINVAKCYMDSIYK